MDGGDHRHAGSGYLLCGVGLRTTHFSDYDDVRIKTQGDVHKVDLLDAVQLVFAVAGQGMHHGIAHFAVLFPDKGKLPTAIFNGEDALIIGNGG